MSEGQIQKSEKEEYDVYDLDRLGGVLGRAVLNSGVNTGVEHPYLKTLQKADEGIEEKERLEYEAYHDDLTGLYNRRGFKKNTEAWRESNDENTEAALVVIDLDAFKVLNDSHGHEAGDEALIRFADILKSVTEEMRTLFRGGDIISRSGEKGDEFVMLLPIMTDSENSEEEREQVALITEAIKGKMNLALQNAKHLPHHVRNMEFSIGAVIRQNAQLDEKGLSYAIQEADKLMYEDKLDELATNSK